MRYGVSSFDEIKGLSGLEMLRAMIAGELPAAPIAEPLGFRLVEVEKGRAVFEGTPGAEPAQPARRGPWRLGADPDRQRLRLRGPHRAGCRASAIRRSRPR